MSILIEQLKAKSKAILGLKAETEEEQDAINALAEAAEEEASQEVTQVREEAQTAEETLTADLVTNTTFKAYQKQVNAFIEDSMVFMEEQEARINQLIEETPGRVDAALKNLLKAVRTNGSIPSPSNSFTESNGEKNTVDFQKIQAAKNKIQNKVKENK